MSPPVQRQANSNELFEPSGMPLGRAPVFSLKTNNPTLYWWGTTVFIFDNEKTEPVPRILLISSNSFTGNGLLFDPTPWLVIFAVIIGGSILFWLPFARGITKSIAQMTRATEQIADEQFDVRVNEKRTDEIGRLGKAINHLTERLSGFVYGQKRFLGDISHELNSPLARMQFALSILEDRVDETNRPYVEDVKEEVELMSKLVSELLAYSKAGIKTRQIALERVPLRPLVETVIRREAAKNADIEFNVDDDLEAMAQPELLSRSLSNIVRNAVRYAGDAGKITVSAEKDNGHVEIKVADNGAGVPDSELSKLFDPFYRLEFDRARSTGGTGLGLAIVKTCIESCQGKVYAQNRTPSGLEVVILLNTVSDERKD